MSDRLSPIRKARELRKNMTDAEKLLWMNLRNRRFCNLKFLRQHPIIYDMNNNHPLYFVTDFYCAEKKLVIEVDGKIHDFQKEDDQRRDEILSGFDLTILRIRNEEVEDVPLVLAKIKKNV